MSAEKRPRTRAQSPRSTEEVPAENESFASEEVAVSAPDPVSANEPNEIVAADVFPDFAASPEEVTRRTAMLRDYVQQHMREGEDYGVIPGANKPTLFKPGAEKLNAVFGLSPMVEVANRVEDWDAGFVSYEVKVTLLNKRSGGIEAEGIGACNSRERRYKNQDAANIANTVLKMAKKRALVDATLSATRASGMFTQDLEDMDFEPERSAPRRDARSESRPSSARYDREEAPPRDDRAPRSGSGELATDAQQRAIMAIAGRVFGRHSREEDLLRMAKKPLEELTKSEASGLIDELRAMLGENTSEPRDMAFTRAGRNGDSR